MTRLLTALLTVSMLVACGPGSEAQAPATAEAARATNAEGLARQAEGFAVDAAEDDAEATAQARGSDDARREGSVRLSTGVTLRYVEQGDRHGPVVVFLHGYTDSHHTWDLDLPRFPRDFHVYALDQRGHGDSERPSCCYAQHDFAADAAAFLDAMGVRRAVFVGHSMGSFIAQQVALDFPSRVKALVLVGSAPTVAGNEVALGLESVVDTQTDPVDPQFIHDFQASTFYQPVPAAYLATLVAESSKLPARVWQATLDGLLAEDHTARLGTIRVPTLIIGGDQDGFFAVTQQQALAHALPNATALLYRDTGHAPHAERPRQFVHDVRHFLQRVR
ncbi:alpha/beta hydrolase [Corallococcus sp. M34]|uniref:alpha/beta fold hydrolase n=1 Tax=Citreicoccus inhibens TaxID=2849499 RepID=UPI001C234392|nr:alpha/beta hydrolase [Citreicoccus inhibens]MBU8900031.1 alpha/beta hydrolase [Citreicoccus inhibens]